jgi:ABC-type branched-subunit amino acid transport system ATPase component
MEVLRTEALTINFGGLKAVNEVDFTIGDEVVGLIGPNGSGKTTFLNLVSGLYRATSGNVYFLQEDITGYGPHEVRNKGISRTFQTNRLCMNLSVLDNMLLGLYSQQQATWWQAIFQPSKCQRELEDNIEKCFEVLAHFNPELIAKRYDPITTIPLIDRRRIEIARAIVGEPKLLLLDEPTAGLNTEETMEMVDDIGKIRESKLKVSIIIIEHDMSVISRITERVVVLNAGRKIAEGTFSEISQNEEVRTAYLGG